ncbi:hypothetical protein [Janthinobacterium sp.]|uniref:hypothetical protein n=1 Tax=Janthinobacterium sp. TaxID=1871054 RepID=UPI0026316394|nr:hypothetical protein [Janthinobacterium sp.]
MVLSAENATSAPTSGLPFKSVNSAFAVSGVELDRELLAVVPLNKESAILAPAAWVALIT